MQQNTCDHVQPDMPMRHKANAKKSEVVACIDVKRAKRAEYMREYRRRKKETKDLSSSSTSEFRSARVEADTHQMTAYMNQINFVVKEELVDCEESWQDRAKCEPKSPLSMNTHSEESDKDDEHGQPMTQNTFVVKEESIDCEESWLDKVKDEPASPLSMSTHCDGPGENDKHDEKVDKSVKVEKIDSAEVLIGTCSSDGKKLDVDIVEYAVKPEAGDADALVEPLFVPIKTEPDFEGTFEESVVEENLDAIETTVEFSKGDYECSESNGNSLATLSSAQSPSDEIMTLSSENQFLRSCSPKHENVILPSLEYQTPFAVASRFAEEEREEETAETYLLKGHVGSPVASQRDEFHSYQNTGRSRGSYEETCFQRESLQSGSLGSFTDQWRFKCRYCGKGSKRKGDLIRHERVHTGEKPYKCSQCEKCFISSSNLSRHMLVHCANGYYKCPQCGKYFIVSSYLNVHMRVHSGDRPYKCSKSGNSYTCKSHLAEHMHLHPSERPFKCSQCNLSFTQGSTLSDHMRIHTGEQPYKCSTCEKTFMTFSHLTSHKIRLHGTSSASS